MTKLPLRRAQLISPTGVGAITVDKDGTSLITAGLDYWFRRQGGSTDPSEAELSEFKIREWRLERQLGVSHFLTPPDMRKPRRGGGELVNANLQIPFLRFPTWYACPHCHALTQENAWDRERVICRTCEVHGYRQRRMFQVQIAAICEHGHLMDFPFREWAHRDANPSCRGQLLLMVNGPSFADQTVKCSCGMSRSLLGILDGHQVNDDGHQYATVLTTRLTDHAEHPFLCRGERAWFGRDAPRQGCGQHLRGALTSATNTYFPDVRSAIFLPRGSGSTVSPELLRELEEPAPATLINTYRSLNEAAPGSVSTDVAYTLMHSQFPLLTSRYGRDAVHAAIALLLGPIGASEAVQEEVPEDVLMRFEEYRALRSNREDRDLLVRQADVSSYGVWNGALSRIGLVHSLRETRVLAGFTRGTGHQRTGLDFRRQLMWREVRPADTTWLPAIEVYGEGLYLELDPGRLAEWERRPAVQEHVRALQDRHEQLLSVVGRPESVVTPRQLLIHSLAHLLINRLTFECGYPAASLRERLYVGTTANLEMAGVLVYTSSGDSAGTLGGLVRMGEADRLAPLLASALREALWCSNDPVCMEQGAMGGQGQYGLNLAACHSCSLVSETSCELFNSLLDRGVIIGTPTHPEVGFFHGLSDLFI